tara:strand:- start:42 stop:494 length:453 start_codon:yes stop_codon:yes gene_type:complete
MAIPKGKPHSQYTFPEVLEASGLDESDIEYVLANLENLEYEDESTRYIGRIMAHDEARAWELLFNREITIMPGYLGDGMKMAFWIKERHINYEYLKQDLILECGFICIELLEKAKNGLKRFVFVTSPNRKCKEPNKDLMSNFMKISIQNK